MSHTTAVVGGTGMVGSHILSILRTSPNISSVDIVARRQPPSVSSDDPKAHTFVDPDTAKWAPHLRAQSPAPQIFFSALATTRAVAGGFEKQYKLEHDVNIELAKAAKEAGTKVYVLISGAQSSSKSMFAYTRMKGEIEDDVKALDFEHTVIVQPGLIAGRREESRPAEAVIRGVAGILGKVSTHWLKDGWAQDADVIAKSAVTAGMMAAKGEGPSGKLWEVKAADIIRLGRTEWKEA